MDFVGRPGLLITSHPDVADASVIGVPDPKWQERPLAVVVVKDGHTVTPDQLREFLTGKVAKWWLPERWTFVDAVPRTSVGKYDKRALRAQYADGMLEVIQISAQPVDLFLLTGPDPTGVSSARRICESSRRRLLDQRISAVHADLLPRRVGAFHRVQIRLSRLRGLAGAADR